MADNLLSKFILDSQTITIKDSTARDTADSAMTLATTASGNATTALNKVDALEKLSRVSISYDSSKATMTITTGTHDVS